MPAREKSSKHGHGGSTDGHSYLGGYNSSAPNSRRGSADGSNYGHGHAPGPAVVNAHGQMGGGAAGGGLTLGSHEFSILLDQMRTLIREEVRSANIGHAYELKTHTEDLRAAVEEMAEEQQKQAEEVQEAQEAHQRELEKIAAAAAEGDGIGLASDDTAAGGKTEYDDGTHALSGKNKSTLMSTRDAAREEAIHDILPEERHDGVLTTGVAVGDDVEDRKLERQLSTGEISEGEAFPNWWTRVRYTMREPFAEFLGVAILVIFGTGVNLQVNLTQDLSPNSPAGSYLSISFGWGVATALGVWVSGGISGGIINPSLVSARALHLVRPDCMLIHLPHRPSPWRSGAASPGRRSRSMPRHRSRAVSSARSAPTASTPCPSAWSTRTRPSRRPSSSRRTRPTTCRSRATACSASTTSSSPPPSS